MKLRERRDQRTQNAGRALFPAGDPTVYIRVALLQQCGIGAERLCVERIEPPVREPPQQQVHLARAAVPGAEFQPLAVDFQRVRHRPFPPCPGAIAWPPRPFPRARVRPVRPNVLNPLFAQVTVLPGIGQRLAQLVEKLTGPLVVDLVGHLPTGLIDRRHQPHLSTAEGGAIATIVVRVERHMKSHNPRQPYKEHCSDPTGYIDLVFFNAREDYLLRTLPLGHMMAVSGRIDRFGGELNMVHPDHIVPAEELAKIQIIEPVYPMTAGLAPKVLRKAIEAALERLPKVPDWIDPAILKQRDWRGWADALTTAHHPQSEGELSALAPARMRLAYDELLSNQ